MAERTVHILFNGLPLCGFSNELPGRWPEGHWWVRTEQAGLATCTGCIAVRAWQEERAEEQPE